MMSNLRRVNLFSVYFSILAFQACLTQVLVVVGGDSKPSSGIKTSNDSKSNNDNKLGDDIAVNSSSLKGHEARLSIGNSSLSSLSASSSSDVSGSLSTSTHSSSTAVDRPATDGTSLSANSLVTSSLSSESPAPTQQSTFSCPRYADVKDIRKEGSDFMKYTYDTAVDLCNTSSRVGCKYADFQRQISGCLKSRHFDFIDVSDELKENKVTHELPKEPDGPVLALVSVKVLNIDAISVKDMDFKMDFYMGVVWTVKNDFFRKYMTRLCVSKKIDLEKTKKQKVILDQEDLLLFWLPDIYFPNAKSGENPEDEKHQLKRPVSRDYLEVSYRVDNETNKPYLKFVFVTSGHSNLLCPMQFDDYPSDVQQCVVKMRSFYYYREELKLKWMGISVEDFKLLEYTVNVTKDEDVEEDHFVVVAGDFDKNFTRLLIQFNFTRLITSKITGVYLPSGMLITLNYFTYYFGVDSYSSRSSVGIMVLLTLTFMFSKVRNELPGTSNVSGMEIWLIFCFICDVIQLVEASIVEKIYTDHCIDFYLKKRAKRELETQYLGYSYSMLFDDTSDEDEEHEEHEEHEDENLDSGLCSRSLSFLTNLASHLILPSVSRRKPEYWCVFVDKLFRLMVPILFTIFNYYYWSFLLKD